MVLGIELDRFGKLVPNECKNMKSYRTGEATYKASSNFFSAKSLFPSALRASAMMFSKSPWNRKDSPTITRSKYVIVDS